ncbi:MAG: hypothetical protein WKG07_07265 [Hymenobacter sp.]
MCRVGLPYPRPAGRPVLSRCFMLMRLPLIYFWLSLLLRSAPALAQVAPPPARPDTLHKFENPVGVGASPRKSFFRSKGFRAVCHSGGASSPTAHPPSTGTGCTAPTR